MKFIDRFVIHFLNLLLVFFMDNASFDFHRGCQFTGGNIKCATENRKVFDLLIACQAAIDMIDFLRDERPDIRMIGQILL